ncbi:MAG: hypothetical protein IPO27_10475 [Bacteroidetes bacterium]|nr:hypothetical protein [Bacteroidota bacterium]
MKKYLLSIIVIAAVGCAKKTSTVSTAIAYKTDEASLASGKTNYEANCGSCHSLKAVDAYTAQEWPGHVNRMAIKARITEEQKILIASYVVANAKR